ncbi:unnamed protein product [Didymodactylos carnosus]|uniref:Uncharacterized protein n=1 Tax=Didymodactylos carnosus TaxID=1234261 RepID=A0A816AMM9_9BILA|nr:unnamed protein product [Didymodactylos carnosus]CAF4342288.1 unnamed protein product [Didymodactylos carnosus]CAF4476150.1 unnamed protein product [Didymodactylos carnosus]
MDWMNYFDVIIRPRHRQIHVHSRRQQTLIPFDDDLPIDVKLVQQYTILPREEAIVEIKTPIIAAKHLYHEAINKQMQEQKRISVSDGLIVVNEYKFKVKVYSLSTSPVTLQHNMHFGTISRLSVNTYFSTMMEQGKIPANDLTGQENQNIFCKTTSISTIIDSLVNHLGQSNQQQQIKSILEDYSSLFDTTTPRKVITLIHHVVDTGDHSPVTDKKCLIAVQQLEFLSHVITSDTIEPSKERIPAILDIPEPKTLAQANRFIGKIGWYRKFIKNELSNYLI